MQIFYIAAILAFAPALFMMYYLLRPYTYPATEYPYFSDPSFFIQFSVGLVAGTLMFLMYTYIAGSLVSLIVYSLVQVIVVTAVLNLKRYRGKSDSIFYGFGFGLGAGATTGTGLIYWVASSADVLGNTIGVADYAVLFVLSLSMIFQYSSVGVTVGDGIARHIPMQYAVQGMIYNVIFWVIFYIALSNSGTPVYFYLMSAMCLAVSVMYLYYAFRREITALVKDVERQNKKGRKQDS